MILTKCVRSHHLLKSVFFFGIKIFKLSLKIFSGNLYRQLENTDNKLLWLKIFYTNFFTSILVFYSNFVYINFCFFTPILFTSIFVFTPIFYVIFRTIFLKIQLFSKIKICCKQIAVPKKLFVVKIGKNGVKKAEALV